MTMPARLYKYQSFSPRCIDNLKNRLIYFGHPNAFNDPFDCALTPRIKVPTDDEVRAIRDLVLAREDLSGAERSTLEKDSVDGLRQWILRDESWRKYVRKTVEDFANEKGVSCFTERADNMLMWSHYADHHRGFCLEFHADNLKGLRTVNYTDQIPEINVLGVLTDDGHYDGFTELFCTKAKDWEYEREWRAWIPNGGTAVEFPAEALTGIYFGVRASAKCIEEVAPILASQFKHANRWQGSLSKDAFVVTFEEMK